METLLGIVGDGFVLCASDQTAARSIVVMKTDADKMYQLAPHILQLACGDSGDVTHFSEFIDKNVSLYHLRHGIPLSPKAAANFTRGELARMLRSRSAKQVNLLQAGFDVKKNTPHLYWMDHLSAMADVKFGAHGYGAYFCYSLLDRHYKEGMNVEQARKVMQMCIDEVQKRLIINTPKFKLRIVDKDGIREIE